MNGGTIRRIEFALAAILAATLITALYFAHTDPVYFRRQFAAEDGPIEYATALVLLIGAAQLVHFAFADVPDRPRHVKLFTLLGAVAFVFAAGEEISWGQRIFNFATPEAIARHNDQSEMTLHNLVVFGVKLDERIFGNLLGLIVLLYLLVLPFVWRSSSFAKRMADAIAVPVPQYRHAAAMLVSTLVVTAIDVPRKWEVFELAFALIAMAVFLAPQNIRLFLGEAAVRREALSS